MSTHPRSKHSLEAANDAAHSVIVLNVARSLENLARPARGIPVMQPNLPALLQRTATQARGFTPQQRQA